MDIPNIGPYASVVGQDITPRRLVYRRGYGNVVATLVGNNQLATQVSPYNRIQPLSGEFGNHLPMTGDRSFTMFNPQTNIAWDNSQEIPPSVYQNEWIFRTTGINSAIPQPTDSK
jgi:hypothetical protein